MPQHDWGRWEQRPNDINANGEGRWYSERQPNLTRLKCGGQPRKTQCAARQQAPLGGRASGGGHETMEQLRLFNWQQTEKTSDDYWTPKWLFDALGITFDLDVACPPEGPAHTPCKAFYTMADDGLTAPWYGNVWMNPPFSKLNPWVRKFMEHRNGIALTVVSKSHWCDTLWKTADGICLLPQNLKFDQGSIFMPTILSAFGEQNVEALKRLGHTR